MWGIPKELAEFELTHEPVFDAGARGLARVRAWPRRPGAGVPIPVRTLVLQRLHAAVVRTPFRVSGRLRPARAGWWIAAEGPLAWLRSRRPLFSIAISDFRLRFGDSVRR